MKSPLRMLAKSEARLASTFLVPPEEDRRAEERYNRQQAEIEAKRAAEAAEQAKEEAKREAARVAALQMHEAQMEAQRARTRTVSAGRRKQQHPSSPRGPGGFGRSTTSSPRSSQGLMQHRYAASIVH